MGQPSSVGVSLEELVSNVSDMSDFSDVSIEQLVDNSENQTESVTEPVSTVEDA